MPENICMKINKMPEFYMIFARNFFPRIWGGGASAPCPRSPTPMCLLVHLILIGKAPTYITDLLQPVLTLSSRSAVLRSATRSNFLVPRTRPEFGERAFSVELLSRPGTTWPLHVRAAENTDTFNRRLKTFLLCKFYDLA